MDLLPPQSTQNQLSNMEAAYTRTQLKTEELITLFPLSVGERMKKVERNIGLFVTPGVSTGVKWYVFSLFGG